MNSFDSSVFSSMAHALATEVVDGAVRGAIATVCERAQQRAEPMQDEADGADGRQKLDNCWKNFKYNLKNCKRVENLIGGKTNAISIGEFLDLTSNTVNQLRDDYLEFLATQPIRDASDGALRRFVRYTDNIPLKDYENALDLVPSLVNLVSLAEAFPLDGTVLPFDLRYIASKCKCAIYFAPRRFTAVQIAFDEPRSRILLFHTGRVVGTGTRVPSNQHQVCGSVARLALCVFLYRLHRPLCRQASCHARAQRHRARRQDLDRRAKLRGHQSGACASPLAAFRFANSCATAVCHARATFIRSSFKICNSAPRSLGYPRVSIKKSSLHVELRV
jgi:hypothetical protein